MFIDFIMEAYEKKIILTSCAGHALDEVWDS